MAVVPDPLYNTHPIEDDYEIHWDRTLGTGVNGDVVLCTKKGTKEQYALKCLRPRPESRREIALHFRCSGHPNIVTAYDVYDNIMRRGPRDRRPPARTLLMVLELMAGGELFDRIMKKKSFTEKEASAVMKQVVSAIKHLHGLNIAHRDLKPENLLYLTNDEDALLKLGDFGFAKVDSGNLTTPVYTPYYAPGEILEAQRIQRAKKAGILPASHVFAYDKSCDMWSTGVILYIILCGYPPFQSELPGVNLSEGMKQRIKEGQFTFHEKYWGHISKEAKEVVGSLLCTDPEGRPGASELFRSKWIGGEAVAPTVLMTPTTMLGSAEERELAQQQYEEQLTALRRKNPMKLKSLAKCSNSLKQRRMRKGASGGSLASKLKLTPTSQGSAAAALSVGKTTVPAKLPSTVSEADEFFDAKSEPADVTRFRQFCQMPPPRVDWAHVASLAQAAVAADSSGAVDRVLRSAGWDGATLPETTKLLPLAQALPAGS